MKYSWSPILYLVIHRLLFCILTHANKEKRSNFKFTQNLGSGLGMIGRL